ncbi:MAG: DUF167 domain-containing protein [Candidatus Aceula meridiana]|nr:DUF167 domain-containing protein [Candidatus Aceula meridiana]
MKIILKVIPGAKRNLFKEDADLFEEELGGGKVYLTAPAVDGKANKALIQFLAKHYNVRKADITIIKGLKSRHKTINIKGL